MKDLHYAKFDETVEVHVRLNLKKSQSVRDTVVLPHQFRGEKKILVFCKPEKEKEALEAGAAFVGSDELIEKVKGGWLDFDVAVATPDMMKDVGKLGMVLGRKGLMPNPKTGTVTHDLKAAVAELRKGRTEFRTDKSGIIHLAIGKVSMEPAQVTGEPHDPPRGDRAQAPLRREGRLRGLRVPDLHHGARRPRRPGQEREEVRSWQCEPPRYSRSRPTPSSSSRTRSARRRTSSSPSTAASPSSRSPPLRRQLREKNAEFHVVKNNFARIAFEELGYPKDVEPVLAGPTAVAFAKSDSNEVAKILVDFAKETPALKVKAGLVDRGFMGEAEIAAFSRLPSRNQLIAMFMAGLKSPVQKLVYTLVALQEKMSAGAASPAQAPAAPAPAQATQEAQPVAAVEAEPTATAEPAAAPAPEAAAPAPEGAQA